MGVHSDSNEDEISPANDTIILCFLRLPTLPTLSAGRDIVIGSKHDGPECHSTQLIWGFLFTDNNRELGGELRKDDGFVLYFLWNWSANGVAQAARKDDSRQEDSMSHGVSLVEQGESASSTENLGGIEQPRTSSATKALHRDQGLSRGMMAHCTLHPRAQETAGVAVGTALRCKGSGRPPHSPQRAELPHWAPTSGHAVESLGGPRMLDGPTGAWCRPAAELLGEVVSAPVLNRRAVSVGAGSPSAGPAMRAGRRDHSFSYGAVMHSR